MTMTFNGTTLTAADAQLKISATGAVTFECFSGSWQSNGPIAIAHYYDRQHPRPAQVSIPNYNAYSYGTAGTPSLSSASVVTAEQSGQRSVVLHIAIEPVEIQFDLRLSLLSDGTGFTAAIDESSISEGLPHLYRLLSLEILPDFGAAKSGEDGYLTLPNWSGIQTFYDKTYPREVRQTIYSSNDQWDNNCNMPVFGITRAHGTLCGLVAAGELDAKLICRVHWEREQSNSVHPEIVYRWQQEDERIAGNREVRYSFAPAHYEGGMGYVFCGTEARAFYRAERGMQSWQEKALTRLETVEYLDRFFLKIFMAYKEPEANGQGKYHVTCSFDDAKEILRECLSRGMKKLNVVLVGWCRDGHDGMCPTRFPVDERLGGEEAMRSLAQWCRENDIVLAAHDYFGASYTCSPEHNTQDLIRHRSGEYWESVIWSGGQCHQICPAVYVDKHVKRDMPILHDMGLHGHEHIDAIGSSMLCYSPDHPLASRSAFMDKVREMFRFANDTFGSVSTEYPFGAYFDVIDGYYWIYENPGAWHRATEVGRFFLDRSIPLIPIVLHGSINCCSQAGSRPESSLLTLLDYGLSPQAEVCARPSPEFGIEEYSRQMDAIAEAYHVFYGETGVLSLLGRTDIDGRWEPAPGVHVTRYSNGSMLHVNSTEHQVGDLMPLSYRIDRRAQQLSKLESRMEPICQ